MNSNLNILALSAGRERSVALDTSGAAYVWGAVKVVGAALPPGYPGELCLSTPTEIGHNRFAQPLGQRLNPLEPYQSVADGYVDTLAAGRDGQVRICQPVIAPVGGVALRLELAVPAQAVQVAASESASFALLADGSVWSWGLNAQGQLGRASSQSRSAPARVAGLPPTTSIAAGNGHVLALSRAGEVWTWGANAAGQLGVGDLAASQVPRKLKLTGQSGKITRVAAGDTHSLAVDSKGQLWAWGANNFGQIGTPKSGVQAAFFSTPQRIQTGFVVSQIDAGMFYSAATSAQADVFAWGWNALGQLGQDKSGLPFSAKPQRIAGLANVSHLAAGAGHVLVATSSSGAGSALWAWGDNRASNCGGFPSISVQLAPQRITFA